VERALVNTVTKLGNYGEATQLVTSRVALSSTQLLTAVAAAVMVILNGTFQGSGGERCLKA
jgi:hypothetical protein